MLKAYRKIHKFSTVISYFSTQSWTFKRDNVMKLYNAMSDDDNKIFFCDIRKIDWHKYFKTYIKGVRVYLSGDSLDTLELAKVRMKR